MDPLTGPALPVVVLTGFLGAGKTTVLNHLLSGDHGLRVAAVVNDFGDIEVDAMSVAGRVDAMVSLTNGCMCCEVDASELTESLVGLAGPEHGLDLVVIEASGLAEPVVLSRMVHAAPREVIRHAGLVQVVDAEGFDETVRRHPRVAAHLAEADLVVVNKCDLVGREGFDAVRRRVRRTAARVPVVPAVRGRIPFELLVDLDPAVPDAPVPADPAHGHDHAHVHDHAHDHDHLHDAYRAVTLRPGPLHPRRLLTALSMPPVGTARIKGLLDVLIPGGTRAYRVAVVGARLELEAVPDAGAEPRGVVVIGTADGPDPYAPEGMFDAAAPAPGEVVDEQDLLGLQPYLLAGQEASDVEEWLYDDERAGPVTGVAGALTDPEDPDSFDPAYTP